MKHFDRRLILLLSAFGPAMGVLTLFGIIPDGVDRFFWLAISIGCAVVIARRAPQHAFGHGAIVGFLLGASAKLIQGIWSGVYIAHNPGLLESFSEAQSKIPQGTEFKYYVLMLVPFVGIASSLIVGLLSHFAFKSLGRDRDRS